MRPLSDLLARHPLPDLTGGKDDSGTVLIIGGPPTCPGAVLLCGLAALRVGAGRVQLVVDPAVAPASAVARTEALVVGWDQSGPLPDAVRVLVEQADAVVIGPGHDHLSAETVAAVVEGAAGPVVLDAGALAPAMTLPSLANVVIAPNVAEARQLVDDDTGEQGAIAAELAARLGRPIAVRGHATVVASGDERWVFDDAPPGLGTPGSGDVLVGVLGALLAAGMSTDGALAWAVHLHARAGGLLSEVTPVGYLAGDIADALPRAFVGAAELSSARSVRR